MPASFVLSGYFVSSSILILVGPFFLGQECSECWFQCAIAVQMSVSSSLLNVLYLTKPSLAVFCDALRGTHLVPQSMPETAVPHRLWPFPPVLHLPFQ